MKRRAIYARLKDNICPADLLEIRSLSSFKCGVKYILRVLDIFTKYAWVKPLKYENAKIVLHVFIEIINESKCKPDILLVHQGREFYNSPMHKWLDDNDILMYSTHIESKLTGAERFIRTLEGKIYKKLQPMTVNLFLVIWIS